MALTVYLLYCALQREPWRTVELFCIGLGALLLIASHIGWLHAGEDQNEQVSFGLFFGSLLVAIPLAAAGLGYRFRFAPLTETECGPSVADEIATVTIGLILFGGGHMLKLRSTTLVGAFMVVGYLLILLAYFQYCHMNWMWIMGLYLTLGRLLLFGIGLLLSFYRDRLLELPEVVPPLRRDLPRLKLAERKDNKVQRGLHSRARGRPSARRNGVTVERSNSSLLAAFFGGWV